MGQKSRWKSWIWLLLLLPGLALVVLGGLLFLCLWFPEWSERFYALVDVVNPFLQPASLLLSGLALVVVGCVWCCFCFGRWQKSR